jgi:hypothetical protein
MFRALLIAIASFSFSAFACPDLAGDFTCSYEGSSIDVTVSQREENGTSIYTIMGYEIIADGVRHDVPETNQVKEGTALATCNGDLVNANVTGKIYSSGKFGGDVNLDVEIAAVNKDGVADAKAAGTLTRPDGQVWPIDGTFACTRK